MFVGVCVSECYIYLCVFKRKERRVADILNAIEKVIVLLLNQQFL